VTVDCTALPETLVESILFGHERGAFTGAEKAREGLVNQADKGTLFLDEIGELPLDIQKSFLRVLQEKRFRHVGGKNEVKSDFRLVAATNRNLDQMAEQGAFRKDLLFRLRSLTIDLPPLRERMEDIQELTMYHVARMCKQYGKETKGFSVDFFEALTSYDWPGNVRELFNVLEGAVSLTGDEPTLYFIHLPTPFRIKLKRSSLEGPDPTERDPKDSGRSPENLPRLKEFRESMEKRYLEDLLSIVNRDMKKACSISGLSRSRLYDLLKKYALLSSG
jgi:two-component system NtrC family response regulator